MNFGEKLKNIAFKHSTASQLSIQELAAIYYICKCKKAPSINEVSFEIGATESEGMAIFEKLEQLEFLNITKNNKWEEAEERFKNDNAFLCPTMDGMEVTIELLS